MFSVGDQVVIFANGAWTFGKVDLKTGPTPLGNYFYQVQVGDYNTGTTHILCEADLHQTSKLNTPYFINGDDAASKAARIDLKRKCDCGLHAVDPKRMVGHSRGCPFEFAGVKNG